MARKYLQGKFTPFPFTDVDTTPLDNAIFRFNETYSVFGTETSVYDPDTYTDIVTINPPYIASMDLYDGDTLVKTQYIMCTLEDGPYDDLETSFLEALISIYSLTEMSIVG